MGLMALIVNETTARGEAFLTFCYISVENHARRTILEILKYLFKAFKMIQFKYYGGGEMRAAGIREVEVEHESVEHIEIFFHPSAIL